MPENFTHRIFANSENGLYCLDLNVDPQSDLDGSFVAWDNDMGESLIVNGWLFLIEDANEGAAL